MIAAHYSLRPLMLTVIATVTVAIASMAFHADSIASSEAEEMSIEAHARLERQLAIAREERDALVLETETRVAELTEALENERAEMATLRDALETAKTAQSDAEAAGEEHERLQQQLAIAREERDALALETEARIAELTEALENERAEIATLRDELETTESALAEAEAKAEQPSAHRGVSQADAEEIGGQLTAKGIRVDLGSDELSFASASATLPTTDLPTLDRVAARLEDRPELNARIEGHTDSLGGPEINQPLSQQRAEAVRQALIERGLAAERVIAQGAGSTQPIADNATPAGRRQNRRVEIYLMTVQEDSTSAANDAER